MSKATTLSTPALPPSEDQVPLVGHPEVLVTYRFDGVISKIFSDLVEKLYDASIFGQDDLWPYASDFRELHEEPDDLWFKAVDFETLTGRRFGVKLTYRAIGASELDVYFDPAIKINKKIAFSRHIHEHLFKNAANVVRLRHYVCPHCRTPVKNREVAMKRLGNGIEDILCVNCEQRVMLWDDLEKLFASDLIKQTMHELDPQFSSKPTLRSPRELSNYWEERLSGIPKMEQPTTLPGYPAFRVSQFRLRNIGPFRDTKEVALGQGVNIFLGDNATGKTTILRCLTLAAIGLVAANEVENNASRYLRKGKQQGTIEVLFEIVPNPNTQRDEIGYFAVGLQITYGLKRFSALPEITLCQPSNHFSNSAEHLSELRSDWPSQFGFVTGYSAVRIFEESRFSIQTELEKTENEWVLSLFNPEARLVHPEVFAKLIRGDTSNIKGAPPGGMSKALIHTLSTSLKHLFPDVERFSDRGDTDLQLNGVPLRFGELSDGYRSLFALIGHWLRCALKARNWQDDPTKIDGMVFIDEIDLHLHPMWQHHVVQDFRKAFSNVQLITSTHAPLVIGALKREEILIMRREKDGCITIDRPEFDPQGMGVTGMLTSELFGLRSTVDSETLKRMDRRNHLFSLGEERTDAQNTELSQLSDELSSLGFAKDFKDPYFALFVKKMAQHTKFHKESLTPEELQEQDEIADEIIEEILREEGRA